MFNAPFTQISIPKIGAAFSGSYTVFETVPLPLTSQADTTRYYFIGSNNKALAAGGISGTNIPLILQDKGSSASQHFAYIPQDDGSFRLVNGLYGRGWQIDGPDASAAVTMRQGSPSAASQKWSIGLTAQFTLTYFNALFGPSKRLDGGLTFPMLADPSSSPAQYFSSPDASSIPRPPLDTTYVRLKGSNGQYLHMENGVLALGAVAGSTQGGMWAFELAVGEVERVYRIRNLCWPVNMATLGPLADLET